MSPAMQNAGDGVTVFLSGDVMLGRGIDQIARHPGNAELHEPGLTSSWDYVELAERASGPIPRGVSYEYVWGEALQAIDAARPAARVVNLETAVTTSDDWIDKGINYRMNPANVGFLTSARVDCCVLSNNHVLDYGRSGLAETLGTLRAEGLSIAGAGRRLEEARAPAVLPFGDGEGRLLVFGLASVSSGVPANWAAGEGRSGVYLIEPAPDVVAEIAKEVGRHRRFGDIVVASVHWGDNWGYSIPTWQRSLARDLIDHADVDVVHGHSAHHPKGIEVYRERLILYGCGDLLNDYEGISGGDEFRSDLAILFFPALDRRTGALVSLRMVPMRRRRFRLERASTDDALWLSRTLRREGTRFGTYVELEPDSAMTLSWVPPASAS